MELPHRFPCLADCVESIEGNEFSGHQMCHINHPSGHFPGHLVMPGVYNSRFQASALASKDEPAEGEC